MAEEAKGEERQSRIPFHRPLLCSLTSGLDEWLTTKGGCRYPMIAWRHLQAAKQMRPWVRPSKNPNKNRDNPEMMRLVEDATVSIIASAAAIEVQLAMIGFMIRGHMKRFFPGKPEAARLFAKKFLRPKAVCAVSAADVPDEQLPLLGAKKLHKFGSWLCETVKAEYKWPVQAEYKDLLDTRNRLIHRTVRLVELPDDAPPGSVVSTSLLEDEGNRYRQLLQDADKYFDMMVWCSRGCVDSLGALCTSSERNPEKVREANIQEIVNVLEGGASETRH